MSVTYLYNKNKTFNFYNLELEIDSGSDIWSYYHATTTEITTSALIGLINASFLTQNSDPKPQIDIDNFEKVSIVNNTNGELFTFSALGSVLVDVNAAAMLVLGAIDQEVSPVVSYDKSGANNATFPYWGITRLPAETDLYTETGYKLGGGIEISKPVEMQRTGADYVSDNGVSSSSYSTINGFEFPFRYHESQSNSVKNFFNYAREEVLNFENDTWNIGRGYNYYLLPHTGAKQKSVYDFLDVVRKGLYMLKEKDFNEI